MKLDSEELLLAAPPEEEENTEEFRADDPTLVALQQKMAQLYIKQKEKGGIINLEEEKNKFLLSSNRVRPWKARREKTRLSHIVLVCLFVLSSFFYISQGYLYVKTLQEEWDVKKEVSSCPSLS